MFRSGEMFDSRIFDSECVTKFLPCLQEDDYMVQSPITPASLEEKLETWMVVGLQVYVRVSIVNFDQSYPDWISFGTSS